MLDSILYSIAKLFSAFFTIIPIGWGLAIGRFAGRAVFLFNKRRKAVAYTNLRAAFAGRKSPAELKRIIRGLHANFGQTLAEVLSIPKVNKRYIAKYVTIENEDMAREELKKGGLVLLTGHFGNWELMSITSACKGFPLLVLARQQKMARLNEGLNRLRESKGCRVISKGMPARELIRHLHGNGIVGILNDQDSGKRACFVDFFGRPTSTARGPFALAATAGARIMPAFMVRVKGPYHRLMLHEPFGVESTDEAGQLAAMQRFAGILESCVTRYPEQWLWFHKRWKSTPERRVIILSDGKAGHLNQSLAVYDQILRYRREIGYGDSDTKLKVVEVGFKNEFLKRLFYATAPLFSRCGIGRLGWAKFCLAKDVYDELESLFADVIISAGASAEGVNYIFAKENNAKSVVNMKPNFISPAKFTIAIVPEHDTLPKLKRGHVVRTIGAPNRIGKERMGRDLEELKRRVPLEHRKNIGLILGGDNKDYEFTPIIAAEAVNAVIEAAERFDAGILVTTSRRTPKYVEGLIKERFAGNRRTQLTVIANEDNPEWTVGGIMGASDVIAVSGESSSMVSEAASSGRRVIVFMLKAKTPDRETKHHLLVDRLAKDHYVALSTLDKLAENIGLAFNRSDPVKVLADNEKVYEAVKRIV